MAAALAAGVLACGWAAPAAGMGVEKPTITRLSPNVIVMVLPPDTTVGQLAAAGLSPGLMSTGIGEAPQEQTYLDISQGNRVDDTLYDRPLPTLRSFLFRVPHWQHIVQRADSAPAEIVPGLLASSLLSRGVRSDAAAAAESARLMAARRDGAVGVSNFGSFSVFASGIGVVRKEMSRMPADELLIAFAEPSLDRQIVPIGIDGEGFDGNLSSDSTRTDGYVLSTDLAPTILRRFGLPIPAEMDGEPIHTSGGIDPGSIEDLADRMQVIPDRRAPVVILSLVAWIAITALVGLLFGAARRRALAWVALAFAYMPLMLLAGAALEPSTVTEGLLVGFGSAALAAVTLAFARGWWALAIACAITVVAYAIDVITGSELTKLSLLGPNPVFGARFYGIGNELEALIAVMVPVGVGAALTAKGGWGRGAGIAAFLGAGAVTALVFAVGRSGADVGAAIVLPVGAAAAAAFLIPGTVRIHGAPATANPHRRTLVALIVAAPVVVLGAVALIDLVSGGNAHLTRSVLDAGGAGELADTAQRRLELSAHDFAQAAANPLFWLVIAGVCACAARWRRIDAWMRAAPFARAGFLGACAAVAVGVLVNDSGATSLVLGSLALGAALAFAWAQAPGTDP